MLRKGQIGSALMGSLHFLFFDRGTFWVLPLTYFYVPKSARAYLCSQSVTIHYFRSGPISADPICRQPNMDLSGQGLLLLLMMIETNMILTVLLLLLLIIITIIIILILQIIRSGAAPTSSPSRAPRSS